MKNILITILKVILTILIGIGLIVALATAFILFVLVMGLLFQWVSTNSIADLIVHIIGYGLTGICGLLLLVLFGCGAYEITNSFLKKIKIIK